MKHLIPFLLVTIAFAQDAIPSRTYDLPAAEVSQRAQAVLTAMNLPPDKVQAEQIISRLVETDPLILAPHITEDRAVEHPGWTSARVQLTLVLKRIDAGRTELGIAVRIERFGVADARILIPPVWSSARSNGVLENLILSAIQMRKGERQKAKGEIHPFSLLPSPFVNGEIPIPADNPPFIPNVPASKDPGSTGNQNETTIGVFGRNFVCGGWNDNRTGVYHVGFNASTDAGLTWRSRDTVMNAPSYSEDGDPCLCVDDSGTVFYFWLNFDRSTNRGYIYLTKSRDSGRTWGPFVNCTPTSPNSLNDKPWATLDRNNAFLTVYDYGGSNGLIFRRSTDRGATWSSGIQVGSGGNGTTPFRGTDSIIYVGWGMQNVQLNKSTNMGQTWQGQRTIIPVTWSPGSTPWRVNNIPSFGTSRDRTKQYVVFADSRLQANQMDVFFSRSTDAGQTWSTPIRVSDNLLPDTTKQFYPWLAVDPWDRIHVTWHDTRAGGGKLAQYYSYSTDQGLTWSANQRVSDTAVSSSTFIGDYTACTADSWFVRALWCDARRAPANPDVFYSHAPLPGGVSDVGCTRILAPVGVVDSNATVVPACSVYNYGSTAASYGVRMKIGAGYNTTATISGHAPGTRLYVTFANWTAAPRGPIAVSCSTELTGDATPANDKVSGTAFVRFLDAEVVSLGPTSIDSGATASPTATIRNNGNTVITCGVRLWIGTGYQNTQTVSSLAPGATVQATFPAWTAAGRGPIVIKCSTALNGDMVPSNDCKSDTLFMAVHNIGVRQIASPGNMIPPGIVTPQALVRNDGTNREATSITMTINSPTTYVSTISLPNGLAVGADTLIDFGVWNAPVGSFTARCSSYLATDQIPANDTLSKNFQVGNVDVGAMAISAPIGAHDTSDALTPSAWVKNYGDFPATFRVAFKIGTAYFDTLDITALAPGDSATATFSEWAKPHVPGSYVTLCSTYLAGDRNPPNDVKTGSFSITAPQGDTGWTRKTDVPLGAKGKKVKDGGCLAYNEEGDATGCIYALKGNGTCEFYQYNVATNAWASKESIPAIGRSGRRKAVKKGGALTCAGDQLYAIKGNNTLEVWRYDPAVHYPWTQWVDFPTGAKNAKEGTGLVSVTIGDTNYLYFLKGSGTQEFYRFNTLTNTWATMASAPTGASGKAFKDGSCLAFDGFNAIYCLKGTYNEMFAYNVGVNTWTTKTGMPLIGASGKKKKVKSGAGMDYQDGIVYALKGNNTQEFWSYQVDSDHWVQKADMPLGGGKKVKGGGAIVYAPLMNALYATKGNSTFEFWKYGLSAADGSRPAAYGQPAVQSSISNHQSSIFNLRTSPNPFSNATTINYSLPRAGNISLTLYDVTGKLVTKLTTGYHNAGSSTFNFQPSTPSLASGVYLLKLETDDSVTTAKLIIE